MLQLTISTEWPVVKDQIRSLSQTLPAFRHDFDKILNSLNSSVKELSKLEVEFRRTRGVGAGVRCQNQLKKINDQLAQMQQWYLMSILSE
jgi:hypothetical protein